MAAIGDDRLTLVDLAKRLAPDQTLDYICEIMNEDQEVLDRIPFVEANAITGHQTSLRAGLPSGTWRRLNAGVGIEKTTTVQVTENVGMLETYIEIDKKLAQNSGNVQEFRGIESRGFIEGLSQTMATTLVYGDTDTDPEKFLGFSPRFDDTSAGNGNNIISGGGSGSDNHSVWLINWRTDACHGIYSQGTSAGLENDDLGELRVDGPTANTYFQAYVSHLEWDMGICVKDWRYVVRIANIDNSALTKDASGGADLIDLMVQACEQIKDTNGMPMFLCSKTVRSFLRRQINNNSNNNLTYDTIAGRRVVTFDDIPVYRTDALTNTEATVS